MKLCSTLVFLFGISYSLLSQDTIHFMDKSVKAVKVHEIGISEIKYHSFENQDGPLYISNKSDIEYIKFVNGNIETIAHAPSQKAPEELTVYKQPISSDEKILIMGNRLSYAGKPVGEARLFKLILNVPAQEKKKLLFNEYTKMKSYKKKQYLFGFVGLGAAIVLPYAGLVLSIDSYDDVPILVGFAAGGVLGVTGGVISGIFKHKRNKQRIEVARLYNEK